MRPYLKKTHHKKMAGGVTQGVGPEFKYQYHKKVRQFLVRIHFLKQSFENEKLKYQNKTGNSFVCLLHMATNLITESTN
jgi:hypothetical protein